MGFWGGLGKVLLKAAPIAASFIPGVGPIAGALIGAGTGAAGGALNHGGIKGAIGGALSGAATGGISGGLGPSSGGMKGIFGRMSGGMTPGIVSTQSTPNWTDMLRQGADIYNQASNRNQQSGLSSVGIGPSQSDLPQAMPQMDQRNPNLAYALQSGRNQAIQNQPWRDPAFQLPPAGQRLGINPMAPSWY